MKALKGALHNDIQVREATIHEGDSGGRVQEMINKTRYADHMVCLAYPNSQTDSVSHCRLVDSAPKKYQNAGVRGLTETPLFVHVYTRGCWIYSQLAISENPKSYILPTVHENTMISYLLV